LTKTLINVSPSFSPTTPPYIEDCVVPSAIPLIFTGMRFLSHGLMVLLQPRKWRRTQRARKFIWDEFPNESSTHSPHHGAQLLVIGIHSGPHSRQAHGFCCATTLYQLRQTDQCCPNRVAQRKSSMQSLLAKSAMLAFDVQPQKRLIFLPSPAAQSVNLRISQGEFVTLIGHSGDAKIHLVSILCSLTKQTEACILDAKSVTHKPPIRAP